MHICVGVLYRSSCERLSGAIQCLNHILLAIATNFDNIEVVGDVNVNHFNISNSMSAFLRAITHIINHSATLIDPIYLNIVNSWFQKAPINVDIKKIYITHRDFRYFDLTNFDFDRFAIQFEKTI